MRRLLEVVLPQLHFALLAVLDCPHQPLIQSPNSCKHPLPSAQMLTPQAQHTTAAGAWQSLHQQSHHRHHQPPPLQQQQQQLQFFSSSLLPSSLGARAWQQQQRQQQHVLQQWQQQRGLLGVAKPKNYQQHNKKKPKKYKIKTPP